MFVWLRRLAAWYLQKHVVGACISMDSPYNGWVWGEGWHIQWDNSKYPIDRFKG